MGGIVFHSQHNWAVNGSPILLFHPMVYIFYPLGEIFVTFLAFHPMGEMTINGNFVANGVNGGMIYPIGLNYLCFWGKYCSQWSIHVRPTLAYSVHVPPIKAPLGESIYPTGVNNCTQTPSFTPMG